MPYWRLSGFYLFYFATLGVLVPYWGLYLQSIGFSPLDIGRLVALLMVSRIVAPVIWAWIADHRRQRITVVRLASLLTVIVFIGVFFGKDFWWLAVVMFVFSFFWNASLPLVEVTTMNYLGSQPGAYGRVRLWGSIGFIVSVVALGPVIDRQGPWWVLPALLTLMLGIWVFSMMLPETPGYGRKQQAGDIVHPGPIHKIFLRPDTFAFLFICFLMQASHGPYYTFYSIYLEGYGYSKTVIGYLWAFGVVSEIGVFLWMQRLLSRINLRRMLLTSVSLAAVRWIMIGVFPESLMLLILAQGLHAASFGSFHATAIQMVYKFFTGRHQHRGQAIYGSASFGIGGAVGSFYSGYTWDSLGGGATFAIAAAIAGLAFIAAWFWLKPRS